MKISNNEKIIGWNEDKNSWMDREGSLFRWWGQGSLLWEDNCRVWDDKSANVWEKKHSSQKEPSTQGPWGKISLIHRMNKSSEGQSSIGKGERMDEVIWRGKDQGKVFEYYSRVTARHSLCIVHSVMINASFLSLHVFLTPLLPTVECLHTEFSSPYRHIGELYFPTLPWVGGAPWLVLTARE